ncbi:putative amidohydrolase YtcJ [Pseudomonas fluvialis]|uniref:Putative amidohydrolase YtcJ n=1 Tax=Pseudomonas fluvialis TaxID=1793966 RepID=A0A7X0BPR5_9PSED|nr:amidohydrolase [Pseudomonas fluvialis]MBB6340096.1 putative amidohydrolase YtcJ [Pseudomonas fluvialis]
MRRLVLSCFTLVASCAFAEEQAASLVLHNARIHTVNDEQPWAQALAIDEDGRILAVGSDAEVEEYADDRTEFVDLKGRLVLPGFQDTHAHVLDASSEAQADCPLQADESLEQWLDAIGDCSDSASGTWLLGSGFALHTLLQSGQSPRALLDQIAQDRPVAIMEETSHAYWLNSEALRLAGFEQAQDDPEGGVILRDAQGRPSGIVLDNAGDLVMDKALPPSKALQETYYQAVLAGQEELARNGITSVADARVFWRRGHLQAWQRAAAADQLLARTSLGLWAYPQLEDDDQLAALADLYDAGREDSLLRVNQIKLYVDGIVHNTTARLREPYQSSLPGVDPRGLYYFTPVRLQRYARELTAVGFDLHIHTIGDQAVRDALDAIEQAEKGRHRLTHVELVTQEDVPRFRQLGVIADFQPSPYFTPSFLKDNQPLIGPRAYRMLPMRELYDSGAPVTLSSDWDVNPLSPLGILQNALSLGPRSLPSLEAAVRAYTLDAAYTLRQEQDTGSLEVGKQADLVLLDRDIFKLPVNQIGQAKVLWTLLGGEETYRAPSF